MLGTIMEQVDKKISYQELSWRA